MMSRLPLSLSRSYSSSAKNDAFFKNISYLNVIPIQILLNGIGNFLKDEEKPGHQQKNLHHIVLYKGSAIKECNHDKTILLENFFFFLCESSFD